FELSQNEHIVDLLTRLDDRFGERIYLDLPHLFSTKSITIPDISSNLEAWIETTYSQIHKLRLSETTLTRNF
ncbi:hypothetical protein O5833_28335, partial [Escherichia coli]|nr:hypothetical protein [Escherichia coli]